MQGTMKQWLHHFECPHRREEWLEEARRMFHDDNFAKVLGWLLVACLLAALIATLFLAPPALRPDVDWEPVWYETVPLT